MSAGLLSPMSVIERAERYLAACDPAISGSGGHDTTFRVTCTLLHGFGLCPTEALRLLKGYNQKCQPPWSDGELRHKVLSAAGASSHKGRGYLLAEGVPTTTLRSEATSELVSSPVLKWPAPDLGAIKAVVRNGPGAADVWESSPLRWDDDAPRTEEIIDVVFPGDPYLCVGWSVESFATRRRSEWRGLLSEMPSIAPNPMVAPSGLTKDGKASQHSLSATARRVYQVVEFDFPPFDRTGKPTGFASLLEDWKAHGIATLDASAALSFHLSTLLPSWLLFLSSGGKSGHSWFNVYGLPIAEQRAFFIQAVGLGADPRLWTRSQFVRVPDGCRQNGNRQAVLYFDPRHAITL